MSRWLLPLTVGHHAQDAHHRYHVEQQDGSIGGLQVGSFLLALSMSLALGNWLSIDQTQHISNVPALVLLCIYMVLALVGMRVLMRNLFHRTRRNGVGQPDPIHNTASFFFMHHLAFLAMSIFFVFGALYDAFPIMVDIYCMDSFILCGLGAEYIFKLFNHVIRIIFNLCVVIFVYVFDERQIMRGLLTRYCVLSVMLALISNWFYLTINDLWYIFVDERLKNYTKSLQCLANMSFEINSTASLMYQCIDGSTTVHKVIHTTEIFLFPFIIEFSMLAVKYVSHIYFNVIDIPQQTEIENLPENGSRAGPSHDNNIGNHVQAENDSNQEEAENQEEVGEECDSQEEGGDDQWVSDKSDNSTTQILPHSHNHSVQRRNMKRKMITRRSRLYQQRRKPPRARNLHRRLPAPLPVQRNDPQPKFPVILFLLVIINSMYVVLGVLSFFGFEVAHAVYNLLYWFPMILTPIIGIKVCGRNFVSNYFPYSGLEFLVVFSLLGTFFHLLLGWYGVIGCLLGSSYRGDNVSCQRDHTAENIQVSTLLWIELFNTPINVIQLVLQTTFMTYTKRVRFRGPQGASRQYWWFKQCLLYAAIGNLFIWGSDTSVMLYNMKIQPGTNYFFGKGSGHDKQWPTILHLTTPLFLFYRFNSFLMLLQTYINHSRPSPTPAQHNA